MWLKQRLKQQGINFMTLWAMTCTLQHQTLDSVRQRKHGYFYRFFFNWNLFDHIEECVSRFPQSKLLIVLTLLWHWQLVFLSDYFSQHLGEYLNVLSALESLNIAILKAMDKTKEVSLDLCEFALVQVCMVERRTVGIAQIHKQSWGYRLQKKLPIWSRPLKATQRWQVN